MPNKIKVKLVRSVIGTIPKHRKTVRSMGLRKIGAENTFEDTPSIRGKISQVTYLVKAEEVK